MKIIRWAPAVIMAATLGLSTSLIALPAQAATCKGSSCEGKDPVTYGCNSDATTLDDIHLRDHYTRLRYSKKCQAYWAQATGTPVGPSEKFRVESFEWSGVPPTQQFRKSYSEYVGTVNHYTYMVNGAIYDARACEYDYLADNHKYCTSIK